MKDDVQAKLLLGAVASGSVKPSDLASRDPDVLRRVNLLLQTYQQNQEAEIYKLVFLEEIAVLIQKTLVGSKDPLTRGNYLAEIASRIAPTIIIEGKEDSVKSIGQKLGKQWERIFGSMDDPEIQRKIGNTVKWSNSLKELDTFSDQELESNPKARRAYRRMMEEKNVNR